ncbi:hypothetical protein [Sunxiuqinia indica]|uniref:hypothetical protein n=1 Tax=Sunxiuqinia indica TaxID=2692584 RepID=UPI00135CAADC|nr:hypothetical protein [Sunxiuqinia indica]
MKNEEIKLQLQKLKSADFNNIADFEFQYILGKNIKRLERAEKDIGEAILKARDKELVEWMDAHKEGADKAQNDYINGKMKAAREAGHERFTYSQTEMEAAETDFYAKQKGWSKVKPLHQKWREHIKLAMMNKSDFEPHYFNIEKLKGLQLNQSQTMAIWELIKPEEDGE